MAMGTGRPWWGPPSPAAAPSAPPFPDSPPSSFTADPPEKFLCPISGTLMADPVVVPPGQTFERACIQACAALAFSPPSVAVDLSSSSASFSSSPLVLVPDVALRTAILNWCDRLGLPHPAPLSPDTARDIVRRLMPRQEEQRSSLSSRPPAAQAATSVRVRRPSLASEDFAPPPPPPQEPAQQRTAGSLEEEILAVLAAEGATAAELASAMASLRQATRENRETRRQLCTPRLLAALRPMLLSPDASVQVNAAAAMVNLSLEPENKVRIVRSGAVSPLVDVLRGGHPEARDHAAGAMYSLAVEDENRATIGVLGAIPPLLELFASAATGYRARREAGMALYYVSLSTMNRAKIARAPGAVRTLLAAAGEATRDRANEADAAAVRKVAVMILAALAGFPDGRAALMDGGAVAAVVRLMRGGAVAPGSSEEEYCISTLYGMSRGSLRFRGLARAAGVEAALQPVADGDGGVGRDLARRTLRAMRGEDDEAPVSAAGMLGRHWEEGSSVVSEGLVSIRRPPHRGTYGGPSGSNTTQF